MALATFFLPDLDIVENIGLCLMELGVSCTIPCLERLGADTRIGYRHDEGWQEAGDRSMRLVCHVSAGKKNRTGRGHPC